MPLRHPLLSPDPRALSLFLVLSLLLVFASLLISDLALAGSHAAAATGLKGQFLKARGSVTTVYNQVRDGVLFIAGAALFGCGAAALTGRMPWKWFWTLGGGIFLIAIAGLVVAQIAFKGLAPGDIGKGQTIF